MKIEIQADREGNGSRAVPEVQRRFESRRRSFAVLAALCLVHVVAACSVIEKHYAPARKEAHKLLDLELRGALPSCRAGGWRAEVSDQRELTNIWASSRNDVFIAGAGFRESRILHFDGSGWSTIVEPKDYDVSAFWGSSSTDVWAVGTAIQHYDGREWAIVVDKTSIIGYDYFFSPQAVLDQLFEEYRESEKPTIAHMPPMGALHAIWGASASDVFAVGFYGLIMHYDGATWSVMRSNGQENLAAVWGSSGSDVYAVAYSNFPTRWEVLHYDGSTWSPVVGIEALDQLKSKRGIWGSSASDIYIVGSGIVHYNGKTWAVVDTPRSNEYPNFIHDAHLPLPNLAPIARPFLRLYNTISETSIGRWLTPAARFAAWAATDENAPVFEAISGSSATDIYVVGDAFYPLRAPILHYGRDRRWRPIDSGQRSALLAVFCLPSGDAYALGGNSRGVLHFDGKPCDEPQTAPGWRRLLFWRH